MNLSSFFSFLLLVFLFLGNISLAENKKQLRYPIVLIHGATAKGPYLEIGPLNLGDYFQGIEEFLSKNGVEVEIPAFPARASVTEIAVILKNFLHSKFPNRKVNLIAHSIGGLGARYLASILKEKNIASITMIATPNRGTPLADWAYRKMKNNSPWYKFIRFFGYDFKYQRFIPELRPSFMQNIFNKKVKDVDRVSYYSVIASARPWDFSLSPLLYLPYILLQQEDSQIKESDGLVPKSSQAWGKVIADFPFDHLSQINHHTLRIFHRSDGLLVYKTIIEQLQKDGF